MNIELFNLRILDKCNGNIINTHNVKYFCEFIKKTIMILQLIAVNVMLCLANTVFICSLFICLAEVWKLIINNRNYNEFQ